MIGIQGIPDFPTVLLSASIAPTILFLYYFAFESAFQKTPGKFVTATTVKTVSGKKAFPGVIAKRSLIRLIPFEFLSLRRKTWWHDRWSGTGVYVDEKNETVWELIWINLWRELSLREDIPGKFGG